MKVHLVYAAVIAALIAVQVAVFFLYVRPKVALLRASPAPGGLPATQIAGIRAKFVGWKHSLVAFAGTAMLGLPDLLSYIRGQDWSGTFIAQYAPLIGVACIVGLMVLNAMGISTALRADPFAANADKPL